MRENFYTYTTSDGANIEYIDIGKGKPLVYLHGFGGSAEMQLPIIEMLKDKFRCITFSQRGYGASDAKGDMNLQQSAKDAKELIEYLKLEDVVLLGYSMGAAVLFAYVSLFGCNHVEKAIIGDMTPKLLNDDTWDKGLYQGWYKKEHYEKDLALMDENYAEYFKYFMAQVILPNTPETIRDFQNKPEWDELFTQIAMQIGVTVDELINKPQSSIRVAKSYLTSMAESDFREDLTKFTVPTAIIYADPGSIYDPRVAEYMFEKIPNAIKIPFMDSTHSTLTSQYTDNYVKSIMDFCFEE